jgi:hypothetical protein
MSSEGERNNEKDPAFMSAASGLETESCNGQLGVDVEKEKNTCNNVRDLSKHTWTKGNETQLCSDELNGVELDGFSQGFQPQTIAMHAVQKGEKSVLTWKRKARDRSNHTVAVGEQTENRKRRNKRETDDDMQVGNKRGRMYM